MTMNTIDQILSYHAKNLKPGESITIPLIKGASTTSIDPRRAARNRSAAAAAATGGNARSSAPTTTTGAGEGDKFPRMAKFIETVSKPDFVESWRDARMYEEDVPRIKDESDDEDDESNKDDHNGTSMSADAARKKKKRWRRNQPPKRHWVLQEKSEFFEKIRTLQTRKTDPAAAAAMEEAQRNKLSYRYEGLPEYNASHYAVLSVDSPPNSTNHDLTTNTNKIITAPNGLRTIQTTQPITLTSIHAFHSFTQPSKFATLSMHDAERAITDQRSNMTRYMMHGKLSAKNKGDSAADSAAAQPGKRLGPPPRSGLAKARLMGKLVGKGVEVGADAEDDDVMGDLAFRTRKVGTVKARKELLNSMVDGELMVDDDGILGGANDAEFGGKRRFVRLAVPTSGKGDEDGGSGGRGGKKSKASEDGGGVGSAPSSSTQDGMAMQDDFYQRDVGAEYEDLDYDPEEQFDDDDVDMGAGEVEDTGGFAGDIDDDDEDDDEFDEEDINIGGFATDKGLKEMLRKSRGEAAPEAIVTPLDLKERKTATDVTSGSDRSDDDNKADATGTMERSKKPDEVVNKKPEPKLKLSSSADTGVQLDENGDRIITAEGVRREIWLHGGSIQLKQLRKIYKIKKKTSKERTDKFSSFVRELCNVVSSPEGNMLVLKQHYSKMG